MEKARKTKKNHGGTTDHRTSLRQYGPLAWVQIGATYYRSTCGQAA
jgi:hypothetical protein